MNATEEMGPIDYLLVEWQETRPHREIAPQLVELVGQGLIRILDLVFMVKDEDGTVEVLEIADMPRMAILEGAASGHADAEDVETAGAVMKPGTSAALLVYENSWTAPFAVAMRESGGQVVSSGRIPIAQTRGALAATEAPKAKLFG